MTLLSICMTVGDAPSADGDSRFLRTLAQMLQSERTDFEIVICDAGSGPTGSRESLATGIEDARLRVVRGPAGVAIPSNCWNHLLTHCRGEWITMIGEADYADPSICEVLVATLKRVPDADALAWGRAEFTAPEVRSGCEMACIPTGSKLLVPEQADMMRRLFYWEGASDRPDCRFSVWHGAVRRTLIDRISDAFSGIAFEQSRPGIDNLCKVTMMASRMVMWERPLSVECPEPDPSAFPEPEIEGFPFSAETGVAAQFAVTIEAFKRRYGIELDGWQSGFVSACAHDCETATSGDIFHARRTAYAGAIAAWADKRAAKGFRPEFKRKPSTPRFRGVKSGHLHFEMGMDDPRDAADFYRVINALSFPVHLLDHKLA